MQSIHSGFGCFCWAWPLFCCWFCVCLLSDETQIWLGDLRVVVCGSLFVSLVVSAFRGLLHVHGHSAMYFSSFYHFYFCQDRASGNIGHTRGKKKIYCSRLLLCMKLLRMARFELQLAKQITHATQRCTSISILLESNIRAVCTGWNDAWKVVSR